MKTYDLSETSIAGDNNPLNTVYKVNGKRVSRAEFDAIKRSPKGFFPLFLCSKKS